MAIYALDAITLFVCILIFFISFHFKKSKFMFLSLLFFLWQFFYILSFYENQSILVHISISVFLPLAFLIIGILKEKGLFNKSFITKVVILLLILVFSFIVLSSKTAVIWLSKEFLPHFLTWLPYTTQLGFILFCLAFILLVFTSFIQKESYGKILAFALCLAYVPFLYTKFLYFSPLFFALGTGLFGAVILRDAYKMAYIDTLTKIPSRRALEEYSKGLSHPFSVCMVDIDFFKKFNDKYGHDIGDEVLCFISKELEQTGGGAHVFRYGGEEFTIIFPKKLSNEAMIFLENTRVKIAEKGFFIRDKKRPKKELGIKLRGKKLDNMKKISLTVSMGLSDSLVSNDINKLIKLADIALYKAKESGRNCLKIYKT